MDEKTRLLELVELLKVKGIVNPSVLKAIAHVPRHVFVPHAWQTYAYDDTALPISCHQTISQPYIVARMTEAILQNERIGKVLEVGTGSGYQAAVLSEVAEEVFSIERIKILLKQADARFNQLGIANIHTLYGDGYLGWPEHAPYDGIIVTAAADIIPQALIGQLAEGGKMIIPVNNEYGNQVLHLITREQQTFSTVFLDPVRFVPMLPGTTD